MEDFTVQNGELAGFSLAGWRLPNNVIQIEGGTDRFVANWPPEITFMGNTYTLENIVIGSIRQEDGALFENAEYV
jgi:hypothetical protein